MSKAEATKKNSSHHVGTPLLIVITAVIVALLTTGIAYAVKSIAGGGAEQASEGVLVDGVKEFRIKAPQWTFEPGAIRVNPGDRVRFIVTSGDIRHGFAINELGINLSLSPDVEVVREVVIPPDIAEGTYTMYCSIFCGIGHPYMKGSIIVGSPGVEMGKILPYIATSLMAGMFAAFIIMGRRSAR